MDGHRPYLISAEHCGFVRPLPASRGKSFEKTLLPAEQLRPKLARRRAQWLRYDTRVDPKWFNHPAPRLCPVPSFALHRVRHSDTGRRARQRDEGIGRGATGENDRHVGMITDRDITCSAAAAGEHIGRDPALLPSPVGPSWVFGQDWEQFEGGSFNEQVFDLAQRRRS
jgi:hypothetical protein